MRTIRNLLALLGLLVVIGAGYSIYKGGPYIKAYFALDDNAISTFSGVGKIWLETGDIAEATVWKYPVVDGMTADDVEQILLFVANEHNLKKVGEKPLYQQIEAETGRAYRFLKIYEFCNAQTAARMADYSDAFTAYMPCRITLVEDKEGKLWLYTLNMDMLIYGGKELPEKLKAEAIQVKETMLDIMRRSAAGDF